MVQPVPCLWNRCNEFLEELYGESLPADATDKLVDFVLKELYHADEARLG